MKIVATGNAPAPFSVEQGVMTEQPDNEVWVRAGDKVNKLAARVVEFARLQDFLDHNTLDLACIGAAAINQAVKAIGAARMELQRDMLDVVTQPFFSTIIDDKNRERTRLVLRVFVVTV